MWRAVCVLAAAVLLASCGGGGGGSAGASSGGGSTTTTTTPPPPTLNNFVSVIVDGGPAAVQSGPNGYTQSNVAYVNVTLCAPGSTTNCQTIDHVQVDTGSVGLRVFASVLNTSLLNAMTAETDQNANPVGECFQYIDGYVFGSVKQADVTIGGEQVSDIPLHVMSDSGQFANAPATCTSGGGDNLGTVQQFGANGILGIGVTTTDCGAPCTTSGGQAAAIYYDCPSSGCSNIIGRASNASAPFQQLPNPIVAMSVDNNGSSLVLPAVPSSGSPTLSGTLYFGIGTETNNGLGSAQIYTTTNSSYAYGAGLVTVDYNGAQLTQSFIDSGSSLYFFVDNSITPCPSSGYYDGLYCPPSPLNLALTLVGQNNNQVSTPITIYNAQTQYASNNTAVPGVAGNSNIIFPNVDLSDSFDYGLPFFYGRTVYTAIEGRNAGGTLGPYFAF